MEQARKAEEAEAREAAERSEALTASEGSDAKGLRSNNPFAMFADTSAERNPFSMGDDDEPDRDDTEDAKPTENTESNPTPDPEPAFIPAPIRRKKKKKKKKKGKKKAGANGKALDEAEDEEDIDKIIADIKAAKIAKTDSERERVGTGTELLSCARNDFDWKSELKKIFGKRAVQAGGRSSSSTITHRGRRLRVAAMRHVRRPKRKTVVTRANPEWPPLQTDGFKMEVVRTRASGVKEFKFSAQESYSVSEQDFRACQNSMDPRSIQFFHSQNPYHAGGCLQMAEILLHSGNFKTAADLVERAVYLYEIGSSPKFSPLGSDMCVLSVESQFDAQWFSAMRRHAQCLSRRGCVRAALEVTKCVLRANVEVDPACALSYIDHFAIRSQEYKWMMKFCDNFSAYPIAARLFPNVRFSAALAAFHIAKNGKPGSSSVSAQSAADRLREAVLIFPEAVGALVRAVDTKLLRSKEWSFMSKSRAWDAASLPPFLSKLIRIFAERNKALWRAPEVFSWLRAAAFAAAPAVTGADGKRGGRAVEERKLSIAAFDVRMPIYYRQLQVSDYTDQVPQLPAEFFQGGGAGGPARGPAQAAPPMRGEGSELTGNPLAVFLMSMLPNMDADAAAAAAVAMGLGGSGDAGGQEGDEKKGDAGDGPAS